MAVQLQKGALDAGIVTRDMAGAARFYGEVLGLPLAGELTLPGAGLVRRYAVGESTLRVFVPEQPPARDGSREIEVNVPEADLTRVRSAREFKVRFNARPDEVISGGHLFSQSQFQ